MTTLFLMKYLEENSKISNQFNLKIKSIHYQHQKSAIIWKQGPIIVEHLQEADTEKYLENLHKNKFFHLLYLRITIFQTIAQIFLSQL